MIYFLTFHRVQQKKSSRVFKGNNESMTICVSWHGHGRRNCQPAVCPVESRVESAAKFIWLPTTVTKATTRLAKQTILASKHVCLKQPGRPKEPQSQEEPTSSLSHSTPALEPAKAYAAQHEPLSAQQREREPCREREREIRVCVGAVFALCLCVVRGTRKWRHLFCRFVSLSGSRCHSRDYDDRHDEDDDDEERAHDSNVKYKCGNWNFYSKQCPCCNRYVNNNKTHSHSQQQRQQLSSNWAAHVRQASPDEPQ